MPVNKLAKSTLWLFDNHISLDIIMVEILIRGEPYQSGDFKFLENPARVGVLIPENPAA